MNASSGSTNLLWWFLQYFILGILVPWIGLAASGSGDPLPTLVLVTITIAAAALARNGAAAHGWTRLVDTAFWAFVYVFFGVAALLQRSAGVFPWGLTVRNSDTWLTVDLIVLGGCLAYAAGRHLAWPLASGQTWVLARVRVARLAMPILLAVVTLGATTIGIRGLFLYRGARVGALAEATGSTAEALLVSHGMSAPLIALLPMLILLYPAVGIVNKRRHTLRLLLTVLITLTLLNFYTAPRYVAGTVLLSGLVAFLIRNRAGRRWLRLLPLLLPLVFVLLFPLASMFRRGVPSGVLFRGAFSPLVTSGDFDAYRQLALSVDFVSSNGILQGQNLLSAIGFWVPRQAWSGKLPHSGEILGSFAGQSYLNLATPLWAEGWLAFGAVGLILLLFAWGAFAARVDRGTRDDIRSGRLRSPYTVLATIMLGYSLFFLRGALMSTTAYLVPVLLVIAALTTRTKALGRR